MPRLSRAGLFSADLTAARRPPRGTRDAAGAICGWRDARAGRRAQGRLGGRPKSGAASACDASWAAAVNVETEPRHLAQIAQSQPVLRRIERRSRYLRLRFRTFREVVAHAV